MRQQTCPKKRVCPSRPILIISGFLLAFLLLHACGSGYPEVPAPPPPTSALDLLLRNEGQMQLQTFHQWITLIKRYKGNTSTYQKQYDSAQQALQRVTSNHAYSTALKTVHAQIATIEMPAMNLESQYLQQQLQQQVSTWGQRHLFHNAYDNTDYQLGYEYGDNGIGSWVHDNLTTAKSIADYQQAIENLNMYLYNFHAMTTNAKDDTSYSQPHQSDLALMQHYAKTSGKVIIVSLHEQAMRVYEDGKLVNAFLVTTGRPDRPTPPGVWWVEGKQSPTVFRSGVPPRTPNWYPDTPINYALQYHSNGYFIHDSWWRADYGPGTNFPHVDASGDTFSSQGSHGCVNLSKDNAAWVYGFVDLYTDVLIY